MNNFGLLFFCQIRDIFRDICIIKDGRVVCWRRGCRHAKGQRAVKLSVNFHLQIVHELMIVAKEFKRPKKLEKTKEYLGEKKTKPFYNFTIANVCKCVICTDYI